MMESLASALNLVTQSCVMLTMDLQDSIPVAIERRIYKIYLKESIVRVYLCP